MAASNVDPQTTLLTGIQHQPSTEMPSLLSWQYRPQRIGRILQPGPVPLLDSHQRRWWPAGRSQMSTFRAPSCPRAYGTDLPKRDEYGLAIEICEIRPPKTSSERSRRNDGQISHASKPPFRAHHDPNKARACPTQLVQQPTPAQTINHPLHPNNALIKSCICILQIHPIHLLTDTRPLIPYCLT